MDGGQTARGWCSTKSREPAARYRSSPDSPLEGTGFEPSVPLPRKAVPSVANRRWRHERRSRLKVQVRDGDACLEWLPIAFPFAVGPRVRMRLPPADLECCEGRVRGVEELVKLGEAYLAEREASSSEQSSRGRGCGDHLVGARQADREFGKLAEAAVDGDRAAVLLGDN